LICTRDCHSYVFSLWVYLDGVAHREGTAIITSTNSGSEERRECCLEEYQQVSIEWKSDGDLFWQCKVLSCGSFCYIFTHICLHNTAKWRASPDSNG